MSDGKAANPVMATAEAARQQLAGFRPGRVRVALPAVPASIAEGRQAVHKLLSGEPRSELRQKLELVVSELVTNAVTHGVPGDEIRLGLTLYLRHAHVSVHNYGRAIDLSTFRRRRADGGRGLSIVAALVEGWSIETGPRGTTVTARVPRAP